MVCYTLLYTRCANYNNTAIWIIVRRNIDYGLEFRCTIIGTIDQIKHSKKYSRVITVRCVPTRFKVYCNPRRIDLIKYLNNYTKYRVLACFSYHVYTCIHKLYNFSNAYTVSKPITLKRVIYNNNRHRYLYARIDE